MAAATKYSAKWKNRQGSNRETSIIDFGHENFTVELVKPIEENMPEARVAARNDSQWATSFGVSKEGLIALKGCIDHILTTELFEAREGKDKQ